MPEPGAPNPPTAEAPGTPARSGLAGRFARDWLLPRWGWFGLGLVFSALTAAAAYAYADITMRAFDWLVAGDARVLTLVPIAVVIATIVRGAALYAQTQVNNVGVQRAVVALQGRLFERLIRGDFARLQAAASGDFVSRFANDMTVVREASLRVTTNLAKSVLTIAGALTFMLSRDWMLTLLLLVIYPIAFWPVVRLGERIRKSSKRSQEQAGELTSLLSEAFQGARTVKAFGLEGFQTERARSGFQERARLYMKILRAKAIVDPFLEMLGGLALAGLFAFAGWRALNGEATAGELVGFITAIGVASPEVRALGTLNAVVNEGLAAVDRVYAVLDAEDRMRDAPDAADAGRAEGRISFVDVTFSYPGGQPVLRGLSLEAPAGATVALVGASGAGKSTVFNLALRLYDPVAGEVRLDGRNVRGLTTASLRRNLSLVSQDAFLFDASIAENIALGRPEALRSDIEAAARDAACDFIDWMPGGLDAQVGENGRALSGGQRQRVALARAVLSDAPVLLLDEATSALDSESETRVQEAIALMKGKRTIIIIAHRLTTVAKADMIYVLEHGRVVEVGSHAQLAATGGPYARLLAHQLV